MVHILVHHRVEDYKTWKSVFDAFVDVRKSSGEKSHRILHPADNPNDLTIFFEWDSQKNAESFMASDKLKSAMHKGGVVGAPDIQFLEEADQGTL